jgi:hypothetical protein
VFGIYLSLLHIVIKLILLFLKNGKTKWIPQEFVQKHAAALDAVLELLQTSTQYAESTRERPEAGTSVLEEEIRVYKTKLRQVSCCFNRFMLVTI